MFRVFRGRTADDVWQKIAAAFRIRADVVPQNSRAGHTHEMLHTVSSIANPRQRWVVSRDPPINPAFALAEVIWIVTGRNEAKFLNYFNRELPRYAGNTLTYHGAYGHRLRKHFGMDQLNRAFQALCHNLDNRQVVLQIWDGRVDLPRPDGREVAADVPCSVVAMLKVREEGLEWTQVMRSNDLYRGMPYNFVQFTFLQEILAGWLGVTVGSYNHISDSLHVYDQDVGCVAGSLPIVGANNTDNIALGKSESEAAFAELGRVIDAIIEHELSSDQVASAPRRSGLPEPFRNILCVICAEAVRREAVRQRCDRIAEVMSCCSNEAYVQLVDRWLARIRRRRKSP